MPIRLALLLLLCCRCSCSSHNTKPDGGPGDASALDAAAADLATGPDLSPAVGASVLEHHNHASRDGLYVDPAFTRAAAAGIHLLAGWNAPVMGPVYAQPLFVDGGGGRDLVIQVTEQNHVYAFDAQSGARVWERTLEPPVPLATIQGVLPGCGNIDPLGITGTPIIDIASRTLYFALAALDSARTSKFLVYGINIDDGTTRAGWPVDINARLPAFQAILHNQRGALELLSGTLYVPFGAHIGDCGDYHGWVIGFPLANPGSPMAWRPRVGGTGIWAPGGIASDGSALYVATGNAEPPPAMSDPWMDSEAIIRLGPGPTFSMSTMDYFAPSDWQMLDVTDLDLGGSGPVLFDVPGAAPSHLVIALGKNGRAYLINRTSLGGIGAQVATSTVANGEIIGAAAAYTTMNGTYVAFKGIGMGCPPGQSGNLTALRISVAAPPTISVAWCADQNGQGSPMVTTTDGRANAIVWAVGAEGDNLLHGFDGDSGAQIFGGGPTAIGPSRRFITPIAAKGRIYVGADDGVYAFTVN